MSKDRLPSTLLGVGVAGGILIVLLLSVTGGGTRQAILGTAPDTDEKVKNPIKMHEAYGQLPLHFEANQGQTDKQVKFLSRCPGYAVFLTPTEAVLSLKDGHGQQAKRDSVAAFSWTRCCLKSRCSTHPAGARQPQCDG